MHPEALPVFLIKKYFIARLMGIMIAVFFVLIYNLNFTGFKLTVARSALIF